MPDKPLIWLGSSRRDLRGVSCSRTPLTGFQLVRSGFTYAVHIACSTWQRERRRSTCFTHSRRRRGRRGSPSTSSSVLQHRCINRHAGESWRRRQAGVQAGKAQESRVKATTAHAGRPAAARFGSSRIATAVPRKIACVSR